MKRHPSFQLCRDLAGACRGGSAADLCNLIAESLECAESAPSDLPRNPPTLADAHRAIQRIHRILARAELRLQELAK